MGPGADYALSDARQDAKKRGRWLRGPCRGARGYCRRGAADHTATSFPQELRPSVYSRAAMVPCALEKRIPRQRNTRETTEFSRICGGVGLPPISVPAEEKRPSRRRNQLCIQNQDTNAFWITAFLILQRVCPEIPK